MPHANLHSAACLALLLCASSALAAPPRTLLPAGPVQGLAPLLRGADLALLESEPGGAMRQITLLTFAAAPPALVREVVSRPERYGEFVRNLTTSTVRRAEGGFLEHSYALSYSITTVSGTNRYQFPPGEPGGVGPVEMQDAEPGGVRWYRWDFVPAAGGTIIVLAGYTDVVRAGGVIARLLAAVPTLEYGLALMGQMTLLLAMKGRAEQLAAGKVALQQTGPAGSYGFLLERGVLALMRSQRGALSELSLIARSPAPPGALLHAAAQPARWSQFVPSISRSVDLGLKEGLPQVEIERSLPLLGFRTVYGVQRGATFVDMLGLSGDLRGCRLRFDVRAEPPGSQLSLRTRHSFGQASVIIRQLYKLEPLFEYGVNLGLDLLLLKGVLDQAGPAGRAPPPAP